MIYIILCGGIGNRYNNYSLPKPLNYLEGRHMIEYIVENVPSNKIYIIYNTFLRKYNFEEIVLNKCKTKTIYFSCVDYLTRGAIETAYIGLKMFQLDHTDENIMFIDNDNMHTFSNDVFHNHFDNDFIGYSYDGIKTNYSFITIENHRIIDIKEKEKISDNYCCGLYGFKNVVSFNNAAKDILYSNIKTNSEFYFSQLYKNKLLQCEVILPIFIEKVTHIGTYDEIFNHSRIVKNESLIEEDQKKKLRICFDLDNTLVTYPTVVGDYNTVKPITTMIHLLRDLKKDGHEIIIYTARRMQTHKYNVGKVMKDIGMITFHTLEQFGIPYDEIYFGKPIADIYVDDRAMNPYVNKMSLFGFFYDEPQFIHNKLKNNVFNTVEMYNNLIYKTGKSEFLKGELHFYKNIPEEYVTFFPKLLNSTYIDENQIKLEMEHINGIPLFYLYKNKLFTQKHLDDLFIIINNFHSYDGEITISTKNVENNYITKLERRFNKNDYPFEDAEEIFSTIISNLKLYFSPKIVSLIHGDLWFSNIIFTYKDEYKFIDMKGQVDNILTTNGDIYYDYGKLYQSIVGYDLILNGLSLDTEYIESMKFIFMEKCRGYGLDINYLKWVTKSLIFGVFHSNNVDDKIKKNIWELIKTI